MSNKQKHNEDGIYRERAICICGFYVPCFARYSFTNTNISLRNLGWENDRNFELLHMSMGEIESGWPKRCFNHGNTDWDIKGHHA